ncbi:MAG: hypothetical protein WD988_04030 [Candidatus Curtissbacteria bacterium]
MVTLTNFAILSRKASLLTLAGLTAILAVFLLFIFGKSIAASLFPPKPPAATVAFGKLPALDFSEGIKPAGTIDYKIETISGDLPKLPTSAKVFAITSGNSSFGKLENVEKKAKNLGFGTNPQIIAEGFRFIDPQDSSRVLSIDSSTGNFLFQTNLTGIAKPENRDRAARAARAFFDNFDLNPNEFPDSKMALEDLRFEGNGLIPAQSFASANLVRVDFYRADLDELAILPIGLGKSQVVAQVAEEGVVGAKMNIYNLERFKFATYPLKGVSHAYEELRAGEGVFNSSPDSGLYEIIDVGLGYIESSKISEYLEPVYIFSGRGEIKAFISAVDEAWIAE